MRASDAVLDTIRAHPEGISTYDLARAVYGDTLPFSDTRPRIYDKARKLVKYGLASLHYEHRPGANGSITVQAIWTPGEGDSEPRRTVSTRDMVKAVLDTYPPGTEFTVHDVRAHLPCGTSFAPTVRQVALALRDDPRVTVGRRNRGTRTTGVWVMEGSE